MTESIFYPNSQDNISRIFLPLSNINRICPSTTDVSSCENLTSSRVTIETLSPAHNEWLILSYKTLYWILMFFSLSVIFGYFVWIVFYWIFILFFFFLISFFINKFIRHVRKELFFFFYQTSDFILYLY